MNQEIRWVAASHCDFWGDMDRRALDFERSFPGLRPLTGIFGSPNFGAGRARNVLGFTTDAFVDG